MGSLSWRMAHTAYKIQNLSPSRNKSKLSAFNSCPGLGSLLWQPVGY